MAHPCSQCDASFPVRKSMLNHKRLKHGDTKQFNCEKCVYTSDKKGNLHILTPTLALTFTLAPTLISCVCTIINVYDR